MSDFDALAVQRLIRSREGQNQVEYALLVAMIALVTILGVQMFGDDVEAFFADLAGDDDSSEPGSGGFPFFGSQGDVEVSSGDEDEDEDD